MVLNVSLNVTPVGKLTLSGLASCLHPAQQCRERVSGLFRFAYLQSLPDIHKLSLCILG